MGPKTKAVMVAAIGVMTVYNVLDRVEAHVADLDVVRADIPSVTPAEVNPRAFYPVLVENLTGDSAAAVSAEINNAFYLPPPAPEVKQEVQRKISPINFLDQQRQNFRIQALLTGQNLVIINGMTYGVGDTLKAFVPARHQKPDGTLHEEMLRPRISRIADGEVWLSAEHSRGWEQSTRLTMVR